MNLRQRVKSGEITVKQASKWLKQQEKQGEYVNPRIRQWLKNRKTS